MTPQVLAGTAKEREAELSSVPTDNGQPLSDGFTDLDVVALFTSYFGAPTSTKKLVWRVKAAITMTERTCSACRRKDLPRAWLSGSHEGFASAKAKHPETSSGFGISLCRPCCTVEGINRGLKNRVEDFETCRAAKHEPCTSKAPATQIPCTEPAGHASQHAGFYRGTPTFWSDEPDHEQVAREGRAAPRRVAKGTVPMSSLQTSAIPIEQIRESPHNHRRYFDEAALQELVESVKAHGVLQPVLVRPAPPPTGGKVQYELVYGHRRFRAARAAKLKEIPATVREMDDRTALEVGLIENCRRADVLPMEEAEGYRELHEKHGVSVEQLAERVGKSPEYVYGRLKLCALKSPAVRKALDAGKLAPSTVLLIARIPGEKLQEAAAKEILEGGAWDEEARKQGPMSHRRAQELVSNKYMLSLAKASFNPKDANLVPEAGACGPCPKRTGNCKALYPDVKGDNVCTDTECFGKKKNAAFKLEAAAAKEKGLRLLKDSPALWDWDGKNLGFRGKERYVEADEVCPGDKKKRTFKELLGDQAKVVVARDKHGKKHELLEKEGLREALAAVGHKFQVKEKGRRAASPADFEKQRREQEFRTRVVGRLLNVVFNKARKNEVHETKALRLMLSGAHETGDMDVDDVLARRSPGVVPAKILADTTHDELWAILVEMVLGRVLRETWDGYEQPWMDEACNLFGADLKSLEQEQREADAAAPPGGEKKPEPAEAPEDDEEAA